MRKDKKPSSIQVAIYIAETKGCNVSDEKLREVALKLGYNPNVLIDNYNTIVRINNVFKD